MIIVYHVYKFLLLCDSWQGLCQNKANVVVISVCFCLKSCFNMSCLFVYKNTHKHKQPYEPYESMTTDEWPEECGSRNINFTALLPMGYI